MLCVDRRIQAIVWNKMTANDIAKDVSRERRNEMRQFVIAERTRLLAHPARRGEN